MIDMPCAMPSSDLSTLASCGMRSVRFPSAPSAMKRCVSMYPTTLCALGVVYRPTRSFQSWARPMCKTVPRTFSTPVAQVEEQTTVSTTSAVCFKTTVSLAFGEVVKVVGSSSLLGNWESDEAPAMTWGEGDEWTLELPLPAGDYSFKFVAYNQATGACRWEGGDDRTITVTDEPTPAFVRGNWDDTNATEVLAVVLSGEDVPSALPADSMVLIQRESELDETAAYVKAMLEALEDQEQQVAEKLEQTVKDAKLDEVVTPSAEVPAAVLPPSTNDQLPVEEHVPASVPAPASAHTVVDDAVEVTKNVETNDHTVQADDAGVEDDDTVEPLTAVESPPVVAITKEVASEEAHAGTDAPPTPTEPIAQDAVVPVRAPVATTATTNPGAPTAAAPLVDTQFAAPEPVVSTTNNTSALVSVPVALAVTLAAPVVLWSEATLRATGCGLEPGPGGLLGAIEGVSYLVVFLVALAGIGRVASSRGDRTGDIGLLGAAEAVSWLTLGVGVLVLLWQLKEFGYVPGAIPDARCFPDQVDVVFDPSAANWAALGRLLRSTIGL